MEYTEFDALSLGAAISRGETPCALALLWLARKAPGSRALQWCLDENWQQHANMPV